MEKINRKNPLVFLDVSIDGDPAERMVFELFADVAPKTAENFRALCTGEKGLSNKTGKPLHYKGTFFHRILKGHSAQAGDFLRQYGNSGESIYDEKSPNRKFSRLCLSMILFSLRSSFNTDDIGTIVFSQNDESPKLKHDCPGLLSMAIADRDEQGSLFSVTFKADHHLDRKSVVFGKLVNGHDVLKMIENAGDEEGRPSVNVKIINSGELDDDKTKENKLKMGKRCIDEENNELRCRGKHKKSSKKRKKKRCYTSESDSSTDTEFSESDRDYDSYDTSSGDTSSSNDDRRKKRKRYRRHRHRHVERKDRRHEKRRRRRDRKNKHKPKRNNVSVSESDSRNRSSSEEKAAVRESDQKLKSFGDQSPSVQVQRISTVSHKKGDAANVSEIEEGEFRRETKDHQSARVSPPRRSVTRSPPRTSSSRSCGSASWSPVRSSQHSLSMSSGKPSHRRRPTISYSRSVSRSSGRAPPRRCPSQGPIRATNKIAGRSCSRRPVGGNSRARSPVCNRGRRSSRSHSIDGSPKHIRRGRGFTDRYSFVRRYRSRSPVRSYCYGGRSDRYSRYRRSPKRCTSPPRGRTPPRYSGRSSRTHSPSISRSPIHYDGSSRSPGPSRSSVEKNRGLLVSERQRSPSPSRSRSESRSSGSSRSLGHASECSSMSSESSTKKKSLVPYGDSSAISSHSK